MNEEKTKKTAWANYYMFIGWPLVGALGLIFSITHLFNPGNFSFLQIVIIGFVSLLVLLWGIRTLIKSWKDINS